MVIWENSDVKVTWNKSGFCITYKYLSWDFTGQSIAQIISDITFELRVE